MAGIDFSAFFGNSSGNNSPLGSLSFTDLASIKNGSYSKLVKSYYSKQSGEKVSSKDKTDKTDKTKTSTKLDTKDTTGLSKMKKEADSLSKASDTLNSANLWQQTGGKYDTAKISDAVKSFAKEYNNTIDQAKKVTSSEVTKQIDSMDSMTKTMTKALSKIGVTVGTDGKLSVDEDKLKASNVKDIKALFDGSSSYAGQIGKFAEDAAKAAVNGASIYGSDGKVSSSLQGMFNDFF